METRGPVRRPWQESDRRQRWLQLDKGGTSEVVGVGGGLCAYFEEKSDSIY